MGAGGGAWIAHVPDALQAPFVQVAVAVPFQFASTLVTDVD
jgi:hypothetical protein